jgi:MoxR-like ATPase
VQDYAVSLAVATRQPERYGLAPLKQYIAYGASPRGSIYLLHAGRALAFIRGRRYVLPQDVRDLALDVLRHRMVLSYQALAEDVASDQILAKILAAIEMPAIELARERTA